MMTNHNSYAGFDESAVPPHMITLSEAQTLDGLFRCRVERTPDAEAYRDFNAITQSWEAMSWQQVADQVARWQAALEAEGFRAGDRVAVMMENCVHWPIFDQAALGMGLVVVPLFSNDRADNVAFVLNNSGATFLLIKTQEQADCLKKIADQITHIKVRSVQPVDITDLDIQAIETWLPEQGKAIVSEHAADDLASIVYTSGTTGAPKGVMLSHKNMLWNAWAGLHSMMLYPEDQHLSFLPLSHTLERTVGYYLPMMVGSKVAYNRSIPELGEDLQIIQPTILIAVPRIFERVYAKIQEKLETGSTISRFLFEQAVALGWHDFLMQQDKASSRLRQIFRPLLDKLVGKKVRDRLGGKVRIAIAGGAPMSSEISKVFIGLGVPIYQGYGLTETSPILSVNREDKNDPSSVGALLRDVEVRVDENSGELIVRSPGVMQGYWDRPNATAETISEDGWLQTGDIAKFDNGFLYITGRLKDILVLANGEKIPPADIESALILDPLIEQTLLVGEGRPFLTALVNLNEEERQRYVKTLRAYGDDQQNRALVQKEIDRRIHKRLKNFPGHARIYKTAVIDEEWSIDNELLTPTLKARRPKILQRYEQEIEAMYQGH